MAQSKKQTAKNSLKAYTLALIESSESCHENLADLEPTEKNKKRISLLIAFNAQLHNLYNTLNNQSLPFTKTKDFENCKQELIELVETIPNNEKTRSVNIEENHIEEMLLLLKKNNIKPSIH